MFALTDDDDSRVVALDAETGHFIRSFDGCDEEHPDGLHEAKRLAVTDELVIVSEQWKSRMSFFSHTGERIRTISGNGTLAGQFAGLLDVSVLDGLVYACEPHRVQVFHVHDGTAIGEWRGQSQMLKMRLTAASGRVLVLRGTSSDEWQAVRLTPAVDARLEELMDAARSSASLLSVDVVALDAALAAEPAPHIGRDARVADRGGHGADRAPLIEEAEALITRARWTQQRAKDGRACDFFFLRAAKLRTVGPTLEKLPPWQQLRLQDAQRAEGEEPWLEVHSLTFDAACRGDYAEHYCAVSQCVAGDQRRVAVATCSCR
jgi:hypothetical protein